jgi:hypothetical protein
MATVISFSKKELYICFELLQNTHLIAQKIYHFKINIVTNNNFLNLLSVAFLKFNNFLVFRLRQIPLLSAFLSQHFSFSFQCKCYIRITGFFAEFSSAARYYQELFFTGFINSRSGKTGSRQISFP